MLSKILSTLIVPELDGQKARPELLSERDGPTSICSGFYLATITSVPKPD